MSQQSLPRRATSALHRPFAGDPFHVLAAILFDAAVIVAAYLAALLLRFDGDIPRENLDFTAKILIGIVPGFIAFNVLFGVYRTVWTYGSIGDIINLFRPVFLGTAVVFAVNAVLEERHLPLSTILIAGALVFPGMAVVKMRARLLARAPWASVASRHILIVGAGRDGQLLARELQSDPDSNYQPVGFVDDDPRKFHTRLHGLRVFGPTDQVAEIIESRDVDVVAIALPEASGKRIREILASCQEAGVPVRVVPTVDDWVHGSRGDHLRDITIDDLLGRDPIEVDYAGCAASVRNKTVLVTGAAGSIGSELCRQILAFEPSELHLLDNNETGLHDLSLELAQVAPDAIIKPWIGNVADAGKVDAVFKRVRPALVYHAAAYKHVPLMEEHVDEAFRVNVLGTMNAVEAARTYEAEMFVLISTDKAVRPTSTMGATKRIAELLVRAIAAESERTGFAAVRFGNVMGSRGSVVPTFMRQIEEGGPVTVMHPDMRRYFISIPEAVALVIQAGTYGGHGDIYMLDMGEEISILELAERMIRLRGLRPGQDIDVVFTGPRPGEKLSEELVADFEQTSPTQHPKIYALSTDATPTEDEVRRLIEETRAIMWDDRDELRRRIHLVARRFAAEDTPVDALSESDVPSQ